MDAAALFVAVAAGGSWAVRGGPARANPAVPLVAAAVASAVPGSPSLWAAATKQPAAAELLLAVAFEALLVFASAVLALLLGWSRVERESASRARAREDAARPPAEARERFVASMGGGGAAAKPAADAAAAAAQDRASDPLAGGGAGEFLAAAASEAGWRCFFFPALLAARVPPPLAACATGAAEAACLLLSGGRGGLDALVDVAARAPRLAWVVSRSQFGVWPAAAATWAWSRVRPAVFGFVTPSPAACVLVASPVAAAALRSLV